MSSSIHSWNNETAAEVEPPLPVLWSFELEKENGFWWRTTIPTVSEALRAVGQPDDVSVSFQDEDLVVTTWNWHDIATTLQRSDHHLQTTHHIQRSLNTAGSLSCMSTSNSSGNTHKKGFQRSQLLSHHTAHVEHWGVEEGSGKAGRCYWLSVLFQWEGDAFYTCPSEGGSIIIWGASTFGSIMELQLLWCNLTQSNMAGSADAAADILMIFNPSILCNCFVQTWVSPSL